MKKSNTEQSPTAPPVKSKQGRIRSNRSPCTRLCYWLPAITLALVTIGPASAFAATQCEVGTVAALSEGSGFGSFHLVSLDKSSDDEIWLDYHTTRIYGQHVASAAIHNGDRVAVQYKPGLNGLTAVRVDRLTSRNAKVCK